MCQHDDIVSFFMRISHKIINNCKLTVSSMILLYFSTRLCDCSFCWMRSLSRSCAAVSAERCSCACRLRAKACSQSRPAPAPGAALGQASRSTLATSLYCASSAFAMASYFKHLLIIICQYKDVTMLFTLNSNGY